MIARENNRNCCLLLKKLIKPLLYLSFSLPFSPPPTLICLSSPPPWERWWGSVDYSLSPLCSALLCAALPRSDSKALSPTFTECLPACPATHTQTYTHTVCLPGLVMQSAEVLCSLTWFPTGGKYLPSVYIYKRSHSLSSITLVILSLLLPLPFSEIGTSRVNESREAQRMRTCCRKDQISEKEKSCKDLFATIGFRISQMVMISYLNVTVQPDWCTV